MSTYTPIASVVLATATSSVSFGGIPQTYKDLILVVHSGSQTTNAFTQLRFNDDTSSIYSFTQVYGNNSTQVSTRASNNDELFNVDNAQRQTDIRRQAIFEIMDYSNTATYKSSIARIDGVDSADYNSALAAVGLWRNTDAIRNITLTAKRSGTSYNFVSGSTFDLYGIATDVIPAAKASGGNGIYSDGTYWYHIYTSSGTFTPTEALSNVDYLVVAGGGAGGSNNGGGGGAGGLRSTVTATGGGGSVESKLSLSSGTAYTITVGAGGTSSPPQTDGTQGSNSSISGSGLTTITSTGGGFGAGYVTVRGGASSQPGGNGGSGGGGAGSNSAGGGGGAGAVGSSAGGNTNSSGGTGTANQGFAGGSGADGSTGAAGGAGVAVSITGSSVTYAGGGGGCGTVTQGAGGSGGGGAGHNGTSAGAGTVNTGGGGGGSMNNQGANGGSGIVIVRYAV